MYVETILQHSLQLEICVIILDRKEKTKWKTRK